MGQPSSAFRRGIAAAIACAALACFAPAVALATSETEPPRLIYRSPVPGAKLVRPETNLILRFDRAVGIAPSDFESALIVTGSRTGSHPGHAVLAADGRTLIFQPDQPFAWTEDVTVSVAPAAWLPQGEQLSFTIASSPPPLARLGRFADVDGLLPASVIPTDTIPEDPDSIPTPTIVSNLYDRTARGRLFLSNFGNLGSSGHPFLLILDNMGVVFFKRVMRGTCDDFKVQPNGLLTYFDSVSEKFYAMDTTYALVDSFACGNGYTTDAHDLRLLSNGHALLMSYDPENVDMSAVVPGGDPTAIVTGLIVQELDENKNVVFQWRSWDHFQITDATHMNFLAHTIDAVHGNALEVDYDDQLLLSSRHLDEITKIDRETGDIIWRWGGKNNQFTLLGDTTWFSHQHALRLIDNGHYTMFDNGNYHTPQPYSRAVEYVLDQKAKTATLVWHYRNTPDIFGSATGYVQRLYNGNTLIDWGLTSPNVTEVTSDGKKVMEMSLPTGQFTYRAYRQRWMAPPRVASTAPIRLLSLSDGQPNPFRDVTEFTATLSRSGAVSAKVYDARGRAVEGAIDQIRDAPRVYRLQVNLGGRPSGVYFFQVISDDGVETRRMVHLN